MDTILYWEVPTQFWRSKTLRYAKFYRWTCLTNCRLSALMTWENMSLRCSESPENGSSLSILRSFWHEFDHISDFVLCGRLIFPWYEKPVDIIAYLVTILNQGGLVMSFSFDEVDLHLQLQRQRPLWSGGWHSVGGWYHAPVASFNRYPRWIEIPIVFSNVFFDQSPKSGW